MDGPEPTLLADPPDQTLQGEEDAHLRAAGLVRRLLFGQLALACMPAGLLLASMFGLPGGGRGAVLAELRRGGVAALPLAASLIALAGLGGAWVMAWARARSATPHAAMLARTGWLGLLRPGPGEGAAEIVGRAARWPQAVLVSALALAGCACAWLLRPAGGAVFAAPPACYALGVGAIVLAFPILVMERAAAALPESRLPEAASLRALLFVPVLAWPAAGVLEIVAGLGAPLAASRLGNVVAVVLVAVGLELALRALARLFLPPPEPGAARAAIASSLALTLCRGATIQGGVAAPLQQHFGLDFSRSWALAYARAALLPVALLLALLAWGMSGVVLVGPDERAVYERFGAPVAVLHPGLHAILPWPLGRARRLEYGPVHAVPLAADSEAARPDRTEAEVPAPPSADRLWERAHPAEVVFLIASEGGNGRQLFQVVSADIRVLYRIGLADADALRAAYRVTAPEALVRAAAGQIAAGFFAGRTLDTVLGENRETMAERMRAAVQRALDGTGLETVAVVIEAIHPPAGAATAYHAVQAAEIQASASIAAEQGRAFAARASAGQYAADLVAHAHAAAAESTGEAAASLTRFNADREAARAGREAFLLERYFASLAAALPKVPLTVVDHRLAASDAPVLDLRPPAATGASGAGPGME